MFPCLNYTTRTIARKGWGGNMQPTIQFSNSVVWSSLKDLLPHPWLTGVFLWRPCSSKRIRTKRTKGLSYTQFGKKLYKNTSCLHNAKRSAKLDKLHFSQESARKNLAGMTTLWLCFCCRIPSQPWFSLLQPNPVLHWGDFQSPAWSNAVLNASEMFEKRSQRVTWNLNPQGYGESQG